MNARKNRRSIFLVGACMMWSVLACNAPESPTPSIPQLPTTAAPLARQASPTPSPRPTDTPVPDIPGPGGCKLNAAYIADVTVPDDTEFAPGKAFTKVWRVRNTGTCVWEENTRLVFVSGEPIGTATTVEVSSIAPGSTTDLSVDMVSPTDPGTYRSTWQLESPDGTRFGTQVYAQIIVPEPATHTPTSTKEPTETPTPAPTRPDLIITNLKIDTDDPRQGIPLHVVATLRNQGSDVAENFHWAWRICVRDDECDHIEAPGAFTLEPDEEIVAQMSYLFDDWAIYTTEAWIDSGEEIEEIEETNNTRQLVISVKQGLPDLIISAVDFAPDPPIQGQDTTVQVSVRNQGSKPAGAFDIEWWAGVDFPEPSCEWSLAVGLAEQDMETLDCVFSYASRYDNITTRAIVDVNDAIAELDELNNVLDRDTPVKRPAYHHPTHHLHPSIATR